MIILSLVAYYLILSPNAFPDYQNYKTIVLNGGYLFNPNEYYFEWFSRWVLKINFNDEEINVNLLAIISQAITIFYLYILNKNKPINGLLQTSISSLLFLTTTIRGAPAYILFGMVGLQEKKTSFLILLMLFAMAWHDSAVIPFIAVLFIQLIDKIGKLEALIKFLKYIYPFFVLGIVFPEIFRGVILEIFDGLLGIRQSYLNDEGSYTTLKMCYILSIFILSFFIAREKFNNKKNIATIYFINIICIGLYLINSVVGIRFSIYIIVFALATSSLKYINKITIALIIYIISLSLYIFTYYDILKNTT
jgi:hypothetical protein